MVPTFPNACFKSTRRAVWCFSAVPEFPIQQAYQVLLSSPNEIYDDLHINPDAVQEAAIKAKQFDRAIGLLEEKVIGGRDKVRQTLAKILTPDPEKKNATATHDALLTLSRNRDGRTRLVTTNFDRLFEKVITDKKLNYLPLSGAPVALA